MLNEGARLRSCGETKLTLSCRVRTICRFALQETRLPNQSARVPDDALVGCTTGELHTSPNKLNLINLGHPGACQTPPNECCRIGRSRSAPPSVRSTWEYASRIAVVRTLSIEILNTARKDRLQLPQPDMSACFRSRAHNRGASCSLHVFEWSILTLINVLTDLTGRDRALKRVPLAWITRRG